MRVFIRFSVFGLLVLSTVAGCGSSDHSKVDTQAQDHRLEAQDQHDVEWVLRPRPISGLNQRVVGRGARAAVLLWRGDHGPRRKVVVFLHGWEALPPFVYGAWLRHLADAGNTVIYPVYQDRKSQPKELRANAVAGIASGLRVANVDRRSLVLIGHTTGAALAFDYAAVAKDQGLPPPRAVLAIYPGRNPPGGEIVPADLHRIAPQTLLVAVVGPADRIPDAAAQAESLLAAAARVPRGHRILRHIPRATPLGLGHGNATARQALWLPTDRLIARARAGS